MIDILVIQIAAGLVIVAAVAAPGLIAWRRRDWSQRKDIANLGENRSATRPTAARRSLR